MARLWVPGRLQSLVSLKPPPDSWVDTIKETAEQFMTARVCFYEETQDGDYDPIDGTGEESSIDIIWAGSARVQHLRSPQKFASDYQAEANRAFRFQLPKDGGVPFLPQGTLARVLDAGEDGDPDLEALVYVVDSAINASFQAVKTVELTSTMSPISWDWDEATLYAPLASAELDGDDIDVSWTPRGWNIPETYLIEINGVVDPTPIAGLSIVLESLPAGTYSIRVRGVFDGEQTPWSSPAVVVVPDAN